MVPSQQQVHAAGDPHQPSRFHVTAGKLGEMQPPERCSGGLTDHFSCQPAFLVIQVGSSCGGSAVMEDEPVHIVGDVRERQFRLGPRQADRANEQPIAVLLMGEDMLHTGTDARLLAIGSGCGR